jgi:hypothetical protein
MYCTVEYMLERLFVVLNHSTEFNSSRVRQLRWGYNDMKMPCSDLNVPSGPVESIQKRYNRKTSWQKYFITCVTVLFI